MGALMGALVRDLVRALVGVLVVWPSGYDGLADWGASRHDPELDPGIGMGVDVVPVFRGLSVRWTDCGVNASFRGSVQFNESGLGGESIARRLRDTATAIEYRVNVFWWYSQVSPASR